MKDGKHAPGQHVLRARIDMEFSEHGHERSDIDASTRRDTFSRWKNANYFRATILRIVSAMLSRVRLFFFTLSLSLSQHTHTHNFRYDTLTLHVGVHSEQRAIGMVLDAIELEKENRVFQTEFARLNLTYTISSKRVLRGLVESGVVSGFDDPRLANTIRTSTSRCSSS